MVNSDFVFQQFRLFRFFGAQVRRISTPFVRYSYFIVYINTVTVFVFWSGTFVFWSLQTGPKRDPCLVKSYPPVLATFKLGIIYWNYIRTIRYTMYTI